MGYGGIGGRFTIPHGPPFKMPPHPRPHRIYTRPLDYSYALIEDGGRFRFLPPLTPHRMYTIPRNYS